MFANIKNDGEDNIVTEIKHEVMDNVEEFITDSYIPNSSVSTLLDNEMFLNVKNEVTEDVVTEVKCETTDNTEELITRQL